MINLTFLETFVWVARLGSFTLAADKLNTTQAAISSRIASLEADLDCRLFDRGHRSISLTAAGMRALTQAEILVTAARRFSEEMQGTETLRGTVRLGVIETISLSWLIDLIRHSKTVFPQVSLIIYSGTSIDLMGKLDAGHIDLALVMGPMSHGDFVNIELCSYTCQWMASPTLGLNTGRVEIDELLVHPIITFPSGSQPRGALDQFLTARSADDVVIYEANLATMMRMTEDGIGVGTIPPASAIREIRRDGLRLVEAEQPIPPMRMHAIHLRAPDTSRIPAIAELARQVAQQFCDRTSPDWAWQRKVGVDLTG